VKDQFREKDGSVLFRLHKIVMRCVKQNPKGFLKVIVKRL
jgi:hypothetical protein